MEYRTVQSERSKRVFLATVAIILLFVIIFGKIAFSHGELLVLYIYGICVTAVTFSVFILSLYFYKDPYTEKSALLLERSIIKPKVACLVAVYNDEHIISMCVESLIAQTYENKEIIIVDDASTDNTAALLKTYVKQGLIRCIRLRHNVGKKRALVTALSRTNASLFAFSDSDSIIEETAIAKAVAVFHADSQVGALSGHVRALNAEENVLTKIQDTWYEGQFSIRKAAESYFGSVSCVSGPLAIFRREAVYNYLPAWENDQFLGDEFRFATDRTLTGFVLGSMSIGKALQKKYAASRFVRGRRYAPREWKVLYSESCRAWTRVPSTFMQMVHQQIRWKKSFIRNIFLTGSFFWKKGLVIATIYYAHILFVVVGPLIAFRHLVYLPLRGSIFSAFIYVGGVIFMGAMFGLAYRAIDERPLRWMYRPLMSIFSTFIFSWFLFYSAATIKRMVWRRST